MYSLSSHNALNTVVETKAECPLDWNQNYNKMSQKCVLENYGKNFTCFMLGCIRKDSMRDLEERGKEFKDTDTRKE